MTIEPTPVSFHEPVQVALPNAFIDKVAANSSIQSQHSDPSLPARTTFQDDLTTAGQRRINLIWEWTQAIISILVVLGNVIVGTYDGLKVVHPEFPVILSSSLFLVIGFYFSRTNHAAIGGIGTKPTPQYEGR